VSLDLCRHVSNLILRCRVHGCQGDFWRYNSHAESWEGNPVFQIDFRTYYESLKNRENRTGIATQALPMFPKDLKVIMDYLDGKEAADKISLTRRLYFKAFATTAFILWTRSPHFQSFLALLLTSS
jgi:hypothetical protein